MKRLSVLWFLLFCPAFLFAQQNMTLDNAIMDAVDFFSSKLEKGTTIAVTNFEAETKDLSDFIIQELLVALANTGNVRVVERSRLELLESELNFNMSGSVSDDTAQGIGRMIGAQILFSGTISPYRNIYRMRIKAIAVETAEVIGTRTTNIKYDATLTGLLGKINPADKWKYQWLYAGANIGYNAGIVDLREDWNVYVPIGASLYVMVQPFDLFGIGIDMSYGSSFAEGLSISVTPTLTIRPSFFEIDVFAGIGFNTSGGIVYLGGVRGGIKLGPGVIYVEARPMANSVTTDWGYSYTNFAINIGLGYQIGFIQRKK
jgi:hypothetical protein